MSEPLTPAEALALIPQRPPFRFVDEVLHVDAEGARGAYTFRRDEPFYAGHFPERPVTPGAILAEAMAQQGLLPLALYHLAGEEPRDRLPAWRPVLTEAELEFLRPVRPGDRVVTEMRKVFWRRRKIRGSAVMTLEDGTEVARGVLAAFLTPPE